MLIGQFPELLAISWVDGRRVVVSTYASPSAPTALMRVLGGTMPAAEGDGSFELARDLRQPIYSRPLGEDPRQATLMLQVPLTEQGRFAGTVMGEYSVDGLMRFGMPPEIMARYAVALLDDRGRVRAKVLGQLGGARAGNIHVLCHARLADISVDRLRPEDRGIIHPLEEFEHRAVNLGERDRFSHGKFLKRQRAVAQHGRGP